VTAASRAIRRARHAALLALLGAVLAARPGSSVTTQQTPPDTSAGAPAPAGAGAGTVTAGQPILPDSVVSGNLRIHHWPGGELLAREVAAAAVEASDLPALPAGILDFPPEVRIYLAPDPARFDSLTGGRSPEWGAGVAMPDLSIIVLPGYTSRERGAVQALGPVLRHELAHIALHRYLGHAQVPRWFSEGYATWSAGQLDTDAAWLLRLAFVTNRAPPLDSITLDWPEATTDARIAYLLSASAVAFLVESGGERGLRMLLSDWRDTGSFETALRSIYLLSPGQLEEYWGRAVRRRYGWLLFFAQTAVIWLILGVMVIALYVIRRRRDRRKLALLRETEPPDDPAYWLESDGDDWGPGASGRPAPPEDRP